MILINSFQVTRSDRHHLSSAVDAIDTPPGTANTTAGVVRSSNFDATSSSTSATSAGGSVSKKSAKKKTVTFKSSLETSDDLNIVMKEPNPYITTPPVPIIKKESLECLSRATKVACGVEPIVLKSRLDKRKKDFSGDIDKLNSLSFKLPHFGQSRTRPAGDNDDDENSNDDDEDGDRMVETNSQNGESGSEDEDNGNETDSEQNDGGEHGQLGDRWNSTKTRHSFRSKKPNKRFLDAVELALMKSGRKGGSRRKSNKDDEEQNRDGLHSLKIDGDADGSARNSSKGTFFYRFAKS